jgi:hypothetical protein
MKARPPPLCRTHSVQPSQHVALSNSAQGISILVWLATEAVLGAFCESCVCRAWLSCAVLRTSCLNLRPFARFAVSSRPPLGRGKMLQSRAGPHLQPRYGTTFDTIKCTADG